MRLSLPQPLLPTVLALYLTACSTSPVAGDRAQTVDLIVAGDYVVTMDDARDDGSGNATMTVIKAGAVAVDGGEIVAVGDARDIARRYRGRDRLDGAGKLVMPGLVNGHTHAAMSLMRGIADDIELLEWLEKYIFPAEVQLVDADFARTGTELACWEMIRGGTTTFVDMYYFPDAVAQAVERCGLRAVVAPTVINQRSPDAADGAASLQVARSFAQRWNGRNDRITPCVGAHAIYTLSADWLEKVRDVARETGAPTCIHLSESPFEVGYARDNFASTSTELLDKLDFFSSPTIAAHVVWPSETDIDILAARGVGAIHNPTSNMKLASGIAPYPEMLERGVAVGLGTDGAASNNDLDMWEEIRLASFLHKVNKMDPTVMSARNVLQMATWRGADAIGLGDTVGRLRPGMRADLIQVSIDDITILPIYDVVSHLVYVTDEHDVNSVVVDGKVLMRDRKVLTLDEPRLRSDVERIAGRIRSVLKLDD